MARESRSDAPCPSSRDVRPNFREAYNATANAAGTYLAQVLTPREKADRIKAEAHALGFLACGIARAEFLEEEAPRLEQWLSDGRHGAMGYMANHFDLRLDPRKLVDGAKSVITLAYNYYTPPAQQHADAPKLSTYAYGRDYHKVLKQRLKPLMAFITAQFGAVNMRAFVDSGPVMEKAWAQRSGVGWMGKHTNIIRQGVGSFFFLCEVIVDLDLEPDAPVTDHCGTCRRCIDACPTDAITAYGVDGSKCISYFTIELKDAIPTDAGNFKNWAFGCDICQQVCPWNRFSKPHTETQFNPKPELMGLSKADWQDITKEMFEELFEGSPVKRTKYEGLKRNVRYIAMQEPGIPSSQNTTEATSEDPNGM